MTNRILYPAREHLYISILAGKTGNSTVGRVGLNFYLPDNSAPIAHRRVDCTFFHLATAVGVLCLGFLLGCSTKPTPYRYWNGIEPPVITGLQSHQNGKPQTNATPPLPDHISGPSPSPSSVITPEEITERCRNALRLTYARSTNNNPYASFPDGDITRDPDSLFSVIEFDDQGELWDRRQLDGTLECLRSLKAHGIPVTLVLFVHGWMHDASVYSSAYTTFQSFVPAFAFALNEPIQTSKTNVVTNQKRVVVGVYLAWRGTPYAYSSRLARILSFPFATVSFWDRKTAAERVAGVPCTEAILSLSAMAKMSFTTNDASKVIIIGHSFGGLIVERAVSQAMLGGMLLNAPKVAAAEQIAAGFREEAKKSREKAADLQNTIDKLRKSVGGLSREAFVNDATASNRVEVCCTLEKYEQQKAHASKLADIPQELRRGNILRFNQVAWPAWARITYLKTWYDFGVPNGKLDRLLSAVNMPKDIRDETIQRIQDRIRPLGPADQHNLTNLLVEALGALKPILDACEQDPLSVRNADYTDARVSLYEDTATLKNLLSDQSMYGYSVMVEKWTNAVQLEDALFSQWQSTVGKHDSARKNAYQAWDSINARIGLLESEVQYQLNSAKFKEGQASHAGPLYSVRSPPADLILLANAASEALRAKSLAEALNSTLINKYTTLTNNNQPWIVSVSSSADTATSFWFPLGREVSASVSRFSSYSDTHFTQRGFYIHTAPHFTPMISHYLTKRISTNALPTDPRVVIQRNLAKEIGEFSVLTPKGEYVLEKSSESSGKSVYWVLKVDKSLIPKHGAIFTPEFLSIASALYRINQCTSPTAPPIHEGDEPKETRK